MNRLVLIGNGFDLAHGLKTKYEHFIDWYWDCRFHGLISQSNVSEDILCKLLCINKLWTGALFYDYELKNSYGIKIYNHLKGNKNEYRVELSPLFERIMTSVETKGWVDVENEYYELLKKYTGEESPKTKIDELNKQLSFLQDKLIEYLSGVNSQEVLMDKGIKTKIYAPFCEKDVAIGGKSAWEDHIKYGLSLDEDGWRYKLWQYGKDNASCMSYVNSYKEKYEKGEEIIECEKDEFLLPNHIMLLNFNYTQTAELYATQESGFTINHIHGKLDKPESVIFGYGDELDENYKNLENLKDCDVLRNIKSIKYLEADNYRKVLSFIESEPYQIIIMGHSCGNSDRTLLNTLFEHKNCVSIKPYYYKKDDGSDNYIELIQNISRNFTDMKLMRDRVVNKTYCEPLTNK